VSSSQNSIIENECYDGEAGIHANDATDNTIKGNIVSECQNGIYLYNSSGRNKILENDLRGSINVGVTLNDSHNNTVSRNDCSGIGMRGGPPTTLGLVRGGIYLWGSRNNFVEENICTYCGNMGILLHNATDNTISKNNCSYTGPELLPPGVRPSPKTYVGISIQGGYKNMILDNICNNCTSSGIFVHISPGGGILRNECSNNIVSGIHIQNSSNLEIVENTCVGNGMYGIFVGNAGSTKLYRNICRRNDIGIMLREVAETTLKENDVKNNLSGDVVRM
jgi:parallel beta-helix repeat protein